ncbi:MAG: winged helix-turn-helix domain-containing protein [Candidatus Aquicultorales bacterium]
MLDHLFKSKLGVAILGAFYYGNEEEFYVRELARHLGAPVSSVAKQLDAFGKLGVLTWRERGGVKYYALDRGSPIAAELESLVRKTAGVPNEVKRRLEDIADIELAYLVGQVDGGWPANRPFRLVTVGGDAMAIKEAAKEAAEAIGREVFVLSYAPEEYRRLPDEEVAGFHTVLLG